MPTAVVVHKSADQYGSDKQLVESLVALCDAGWRVTLVLPTSGPLEGLVANAAPEVRVLITPFFAKTVIRRELLRPLPFARLLLRAPLDALRAVRLLRVLSPDVVYVNTVTVPLWIAAGRLAFIPTLVHVHEAEDSGPRLIRLAVALPVCFASMVIANSTASERVLYDTISLLRHRTRVIANGVPDHDIPIDSESEQGLLVLVARLSPRKGIDVALDAVGLLRTDGRKVRIEVCGSAYPGYEWYERELRARAERPDLLGAVTFRGYVAPIGPYLARAEIVLVPSRSEPFGNTAVEALLARRAVIVSSVQGLREIVAHGLTGLLVPPDDPAALAEAIGRLIDAPDLAREMGSRGRIDAIARFSTARYAEQIVAALDDLSRRGRRGQSARRGRSKTQ